MTKKYHLKIKWEDRDKTIPFDIVLYDGGQPLAGFKSLEEARLVRDILNELNERMDEWHEYSLYLRAILEEHEILYD